MMIASAWHLPLNQSPFKRYPPATARPQPPWPPVEQHPKHPGPLTRSRPSPPGPPPSLQTSSDPKPGRGWSCVDLVDGKAWYNMIYYKSYTLYKRNNIKHVELFRWYAWWISAKNWTTSTLAVQRVAHENSRKSPEFSTQTARAKSRPPNAAGGTCKWWAPVLPHQSQRTSHQMTGVRAICFPTRDGVLGVWFFML